VGSIQNELTIFYRNLREITFRLTNVIPERFIFVSRGITVNDKTCITKKKIFRLYTKPSKYVIPIHNYGFLRILHSLVTITYEFTMWMNKHANSSRNLVWQSHLRLLLPCISPKITTALPSGILSRTTVSQPRNHVVVACLPPLDVGAKNLKILWNTA